MPLFNPPQIITIYPIGGTSDDWPRLIALANANAYKNKIVMGYGTWLCKTAGTLVSGANIECAPGVTIVSSLTPNGDGTTECVFKTAANSSGNPANSISTTLAANTILGSFTVSTTAALNVGDYFYISNDNATNVFQQFKVLKVSGSGPYTITTDVPVMYADAFLASGSHVVTFVPSEDIVLNGNNAIITGTGNRCFEFTLSRNCKIRNFKITTASGVFTNIICSFDVGAYNCEFENMNVSGGKALAGTVAQAAIALESNYGSRIINSRAADSAVGFYVTDCRGCTIENPLAEYNTSNLSLTVDGTGVNGSRYCHVMGGTLSAGGYGAHVFASPYNTFVGTKFIGNTTNGSYVDNRTGSGYGVGGKVDFIGCLYTSNKGSTGGAGSLSDVEYTDCNWVEDGYGGASIYVAAGNATIDGGKTSFSIDSANTGFGIYAITTGKVKVNNFRIDLPASPTNGMDGIICQSGSANSRLELSNVTCTGGKFGLYIYSTSGTYRRGANVSFESATTPVTLNSNPASYGTVTLNGATGVDITFADAKTEDLDKFVLTRKTAGGTPGAPPLVAVTVGSKFTVTGIALDTSVYYWSLS